MIPTMIYPLKIFLDTALVIQRITSGTQETEVESYLIGGVKQDVPKGQFKKFHYNVY